MYRKCNIVLDVDDSLLESIAEQLDFRKGSPVYKNLVCSQSDNKAYMYPATLVSGLPCYTYNGEVFQRCTHKELLAKLVRVDDEDWYSEEEDDEEED